METFYSILFVQLKQEAQERLSVGLFMRDADQVFFSYSKFKLQLIKELLDKPALDLLTLNLRNIDRTVSRAMEAEENPQFNLYDKAKLNEPSLQDGHFSYLSRYSNNLLSFSDPKPIDISLNGKNFETFFSKLVDERHFQIPDKKVEIDIVQRTRSTLRPFIKDRVNWDFEITDEYIPHLILPSIRMDFVGKNEILVSGQALSFKKPVYNLEVDVSKHIVLLDAMKQANEYSTSFIIGKEPDKKLHPKNHSIWKNVVEENRIEFVDADEFERITEYVEEHDVKPLVPIED